MHAFWLCYFIVAVAVVKSNAKFKVHTAISASFSFINIHVWNWYSVSFFIKLHYIYSIYLFQKPKHMYAARPFHIIVFKPFVSCLSLVLQKCISIIICCNDTIILNFFEFSNICAYIQSELNPDAILNVFLKWSSLKKFQTIIIYTPNFGVFAVKDAFIFSINRMR